MKITKGEKLQGDKSREYGGCSSLRNSHSWSACLISSVLWMGTLLKCST
jgi:hypothetical protein